MLLGAWPRRWGGEGEGEEGAAWRGSREESEPGAAARGAVEGGVACDSLYQETDWEGVSGRKGVRWGVQHALNWVTSLYF